MTTGRTLWWAKDAAWWRRELIVELGEEYGPAAPAVLDWLSCEAKAQNDGGYVKAGYKTCARGCFVDVVTVRHVVSRAVQLGVLEDFKERETRFTCRISGWQQDQERVAAAVRKAQSRARQQAQSQAPEPDQAPGQVVTNRDTSRPVTPRPTKSRTGQNRTEEQQPPQPPKGGRERDRDVWHQDLDAWARANDITDDISLSLVRRFVGRGPCTREQVLAHLSSHPSTPGATAEAAA